jgi:hypothetical protein
MFLPSLRPQKFTASTRWYDDSKDWKSQMSSFSSVANVSIHAHKMGGCFGHSKMVGSTSLGLPLHELLPLVLLTTPENVPPTLANITVGFCYRACCPI